MIVVPKPRSRRPSPFKVRVVLNITPELADRLKALAQSERRPLTTQIEILVEHGLRAMQVAA